MYLDESKALCDTLVPPGCVAASKGWLCESEALNVLIRKMDEKRVYLDGLVLKRERNIVHVRWRHCYFYRRFSG